MNMYFVAGLTSFLLTIIGIFAALKIFPKIKLLDRPQEYGLSRKPIPYSGGLIVFLVFLICTAVFVKFTLPLFGVLIGVFILTLVSFLDDRFKINPLIRLIVQLLSTLIVVLAGTKITIVTNPLGGVITLGHLASFITVFWLIGMTNVMNWLDGINGLASGVSTIAFTIIFMLAVRPNFHVIDQTHTAFMAIILAASTFGFVLFEFYPAKILMGDTGTMFLGFMLGVLAIFSGGKIATAFLVMGFPILDAVLVFTKRIIQKKSPFHGDLTHLHHQMLDLGISDRKALIINYILCALFGLVALYGSNAQEKLVMIFVLVFTAAIFFGSVLYLKRKSNARHSQ